MRKAMNFLGKAGEYKATGVHNDLGHLDLASVAAERIVKTATAPKPDRLSVVQPLTIQSLKEGR